MTAKADWTNISDYVLISIEMGQGELETRYAAEFSEEEKNNLAAAVRHGNRHVADLDGDTEWLFEALPDLYKRAYPYTYQTGQRVSCKDFVFFDEEIEGFVAKQLEDGKFLVKLDRPFTRENTNKGSAWVTVSRDFAEDVVKEISR